MRIIQSQLVVSGWPMIAMRRAFGGVKESFHGGQRDGLMRAIFRPWPSPVGNSIADGRDGAGDHSRPDKYARMLRRTVASADRTRP